MLFASGRRSRLRGKARPWLFLAGAAAAVSVLAVAIARPDFVPSERQVEGRLRVLAARSDFPLHDLRCVRDEILPRTFTCFGEGPFDLHMALRVRWLPGGDLEVRRPDGTGVRF